MIIEGFYQTIINQQCIITRSSDSSGKQSGAKVAKPIQCYRLMASRRPLDSVQLQNCWQFKIDHQLKFISRVNANGGEKVIAVSVIGSKQDDQYCELSVSVNEQWQQQGLAEILCKKLLEFTQQRGMLFFYSDDQQPGNILGLESLIQQDDSYNNIITYQSMSA